MSLIDRFRDVVVRPPAGDAWDDEGVEDVAALMTAIVATADADGDDRRPDVSRAAVLGAFAGASARGVGSRQGAAGRSRLPTDAAPGIRRGGRRPVLILVAACALLAASLGTVAASAPGGPLYDARVAAEALGLPQQPADRAEAQVGRLDARVREALDAAERGDVPAVSAALAAYARVATEAAADPVADPTTATPLAMRVRVQLEVIAGIGTGDRGLEAVRERDRVAARAFLAALGEPGDDAGPGAGPGPGPDASSESPPGTPTPPRGSPPATTPGRTQGPSASPGPQPSASPGGQGSAPSPKAPTMTPRASGNPSATPSGSGSGSGSSGGGDGGGTPRPTGESGGGSGGGAGGGSGGGAGGGSGGGSGSQIES